MKKRMMMLVFLLALMMTCFQRTENVAAAKTKAKKIKVKKPIITVKKKTKNSVKLSIRSSNKKLSGYKFYQKKGKKYVLVKTVKVKKGSTKKSYTFKRLKKNTSYKFKVVAYRKYKGKTYSASKTKTVKTDSGSTANSTKGNTTKTDPVTKIEWPSYMPADFQGYNDAEYNKNFQQDMVDMINIFRREAGLKEVRLNKDLCELALYRAKRSANDELASAHQYGREDFQTFFVKRGYKGHFFHTVYGENAAGSDNLEDALLLSNGNLPGEDVIVDSIWRKKIYQCYPEGKWRNPENGEYHVYGNGWDQLLCRWMESDGHRGWIMSEQITEMGVAYYKGAWYQTFSNIHDVWNED